MDATDDSPTVRLELDSRPETLTLVRGALAGIAELLVLDPELLDDLKTAVSEACNNVVMHAYEDGPGPLSVCVYVNPETIDVVVRDLGAGIPALAPQDESVQGVGLPVIRALAEHAEFRPHEEGGTEVRMRFAGTRGGQSLFHSPGQAAPEDGRLRQLSGDAVVSLSPVLLVAAVLGRLARALAARARFSLDRFSDAYLVTDAIAAHAIRAASGARIAFAITTTPRRLELTLGPLRAEASAELRGGERVPVASALALLSDELEIVSANGGEMLHVVMFDEHPRRRRSEPSATS